MNIAFTFKNLEPSTSLSQHVERRFSKLKRMLKNNEDAEISVLFSVDKFRHKAEIKLKKDGTSFSAAEETDDMYASIDLALSKVTAQIKKHSEHEKSAVHRSLPNTDDTMYDE